MLISLLLYVHEIWGQKLLKYCTINSVSKLYQRLHEIRMGGCRQLTELPVQLNFLIKNLDNCKLIRCFVINLQIGYRHVVDATLQEEACSLASLLIAVTSKGALTCMKKIGKGSLDPESIFEMMEVRSFEQLLSCMIMDELELEYMRS